MKLVEALTPRYIGPYATSCLMKQPKILRTRSPDRLLPRIASKMECR